MSFYFLFKKWVGALFAPLPIVILLIVIAFILRKKSQTLFNTLFVCSFSLLLIFSLPFTSNLLLRPLELYNDNHTRDIAQFSHIKHIVVLGCKHHEEPLQPLVSQIHNCSFKRVVQGVLLYQQLTKLHQTTLYFSGSTGRINQIAEANMNAALATQLGVPSHHQIVLASPRDTYQEAQALAPYLSGKTVALVTSASHFGRAIDYFAQHNINVEPFPVEHLSSQYQGYKPSQFIPSAAALQRSERAMYEYLGRAAKHLGMK